LIVKVSWPVWKNLFQPFRGCPLYQTPVSLGTTKHRLFLRGFHEDITVVSLSGKQEIPELKTTISLIFLKKKFMKAYGI
jgi:hypothetical protein